MPALDARPLRIVVVDDEECVRKALQRLLRSAGMEVATFGSGNEFLGGAHEGLDCVVVDLHMTAGGGLEVAERLARDAPSLPVVILTAHDKPEYRLRARELGVCAFLCKPIESDVLLDAIRTATAR